MQDQQWILTKQQITEKIYNLFGAQVSVIETALPPLAVVEFFRSATSPDAAFEAVSADRILDQETMDEVCAEAGLRREGR